ncbi:MAG: S1-like domain-containing RNA-binding protein [Cyclobacteriaceae bacterium]
MAIPIIEIGKVNSLEVLKLTEQGYYVGDTVEEILLPNKYIPDGLEVGDMIDVFIYTDSEDRLIATTLTPKIMLDEIAYLEVKDTTSFGAFLDWGLEKDLLVPFKEQIERMEKGEKYLVYMYLDDLTDRLVASAHINKLIEFDDIDLEVGEKVDVLVGPETDIGYVSIIDNLYRGLIYKNQVFKNIQPGDQTVAYVKEVRPDSKVDLSLEPLGVESIEPNAQKILDKLKKEDGKLKLHDKSHPDEIRNLLGMSKKNFKRSIGSLYKQRKIKILEDSIELI